MPPILPNSQILGASDNQQESGLDKEVVERNVEAMRNKKSEEPDFSDFNSETFEAVCSSKNPGDVDGIASGNRTDGSFTDAQFSSSELCVPYDDLAELEWLSSFVEESFSSDDMQNLQFIPTSVTTSYKNSPIFNADVSVPGKARNKRSRAAPCDWSSRLLHLSPAKAPARKRENAVEASGSGRKCLHCASEKTPQWRTGPLGPKTLCNACGVRFKSGRLVSGYRPPASPTFVSAKHSNSHRIKNQQESGLDKEVVERNVEAMRNKKSEEPDFSDFNWETFEAVCSSKNPEDVDGIASGNRTDGDCSITGSDQGIGDWNAEGMRGRKSAEEVLGCSAAEGNWDYVEAYLSSAIGNEMEGTIFREDIDSIASGTNTDGYSENEAISRVYQIDNTVQRPGFFSTEKGKGIKRNSWGDIGSARKNYRSISGASRAGNQHSGSVPTPPIQTHSSFFPDPLSVSSYPDDSTTLNSSALSADLSMKDCNGESLPTCKVPASSFTGEGNTEKMVYSAPEISLKEAALHIGHNVADPREAHTSKSEQESEKNISYTHESLSQHFGKPLDDARKSFGVSRTAFKAMCRDVGITRWKYGKRNMGRSSSETRRRRINDQVPAGNGNFPSDMPPVQFAPVVAHTTHNLNTMITVKATHNGAHIRFKLPDSSGISELEENVMKRLHLKINTFTIEYLDDDGEWILITCDEDVQECIEVSRHLETKTIRMLIIDRPVDCNAP